MTQILLGVAVLALLGGAVLQIVLALAGYRAAQTVRVQAPAAPNGQISRLESEIRVLSGDALEAKRRLAVLEQCLAELAERLDSRERDAVPQAYEVAVNLVRQGVAIDDLVATCGLSRGEAELVARLYGRASTGSVAVERQSYGARGA